VLEFTLLGIVTELNIMKFVVQCCTTIICYVGNISDILFYAKIYYVNIMRSVITLILLLGPATKWFQWMLQFYKSLCESIKLYLYS
jgi:hypothetical protein